MIYINTFFSEIYKIIFLLLPVLVSIALIVWLDRRIWAFVQKRKGPNVVGPFGILQTLADALKFIFKEIIIPASANKFARTNQIHLCGVSMIDQQVSRLATYRSAPPMSE